jgi:phosphoribosylformylglycinamidine cyclo-ligase
MPGVYADNDFDCAGFAVGIVDEEKTWGSKRVRVGDVLIGVASSGFHSNGFSLLRKVFEKDLDQYSQQLLVPTALYVKMCAELAALDIHAAAHITGGGLENVPRILPENTVAEIKAWEFPELFQEVQRRTRISAREMMDTLNCGLGFVLVVPPEQAAAVLAICSKHHRSWELGRVTTGSGEAQVRVL